MENLTRAFSRIWPAFEHAGLPPRIRRRVELVFEELFSNTVTHGYKVDQASTDDSATDQNVVWIELRATPGQVLMIYQDAAPPFNPLAAELPDLTVGVEERSLGGLGLIMVAKVPQESLYEYRDGRNFLHLTFQDDATRNSKF